MAGDVGYLRPVLVGGGDGCLLGVKMKNKVEQLFHKLKPMGVFLRPLNQFSLDAKYMKRGDVFRVTVDIPASQISKTKDVRALFGDADCQLIPVLAFIENGDGASQ